MIFSYRAKQVLDINIKKNYLEVLSSWLFIQFESFIKSSFLE
jgi:hypothetical protein